jgi:hypothetical protein
MKENHLQGKWAFLRLAITILLLAIAAGGAMIIFLILQAAGLLVPAIPLTLAITAVMAGMIACVLKNPLVVIVLLALVFLQPGVVLPIIIATLAGNLATRRVTMIPAPRQG